MKILMLCDFFEPVRKVGAVRPSDFAKCLHTLGYEVYVITFSSSKWLKDNDFLDFCQVSRIDIDTNKYFKSFFFYDNFINKIKKKQNSTNSQLSSNDSKKISFLSKFKNKVKSFISTSRDILFGKCGAKAMFNVFTSNYTIPFDIVFSTYGGFSSTLCARKIKKKFNRIKWIADFRDGVYYEMFVKANKSYYKNFISNKCNICDSLIFASSGYLNDSKLPASFKGSVSVIENGFMDFILSDNKKHNTLNFIYAGSFYGERHLPSFFDSISKVSGNYNDLLIKIIFCGDKNSFQLFYEEAKKYKVENYLYYKGELSKKELLSEEKNSDVFLIASWNFLNYSGVLPGKLFEYFSFRKPIIGHVSGNEPNSLLKQMINSNNLGYCSDDIDENDYDKMYNYVLNLYKEFLNKGYIDYNGNMEFVTKYHRIKQVKQLLKTVNIDEK